MTPKERLKLIGWSIGYIVGGLLLAGLLVAPVMLVLPPGLGLGSLVIVQAVAMLAAFALLSWLIGGRILAFSPAEFQQLDPKTRLPARFGRFGWGAAVGVLLAVIAMLVAVPAGGAAWLTEQGGPLSWLAAVLVIAAMLLPAALAEELAFRGVPLLALSRALGRLPAIGVLAAGFALAHLANPSVTPLALANIALAGVFLSLAFFTPGGLWTSTGAHFGWNLTLAGLGAPVSGLPLPGRWLDYAPGGPEWLTGGGFGPEGGALASLCLLGGTWIVARRVRKGATSP